MGMVTGSGGAVGVGGEERVAETGVYKFVYASC